MEQKKKKKGINVNSGADYLASLTPQDRAWLEANMMLSDALPATSLMHLPEKQRRALNRAKYNARNDALNKSPVRIDRVDAESGEAYSLEVEAPSNPELNLIAKQAVYDKVQKHRNKKVRGKPKKDANDPQQKEVLDGVVESFQSLCLPRPSSV